VGDKISLYLEAGFILSSSLALWRGTRADRRVISLLWSEAKPAFVTKRWGILGRSGDEKELGKGGPPAPV